jgi:hypothetical protein
MDSATVTKLSVSLCVFRAASTLISNNYDFVVTDSMNFDHDTGDYLKSPYEFDKTMYA